MGCALSFLSNAGPYITERDLDDANDLVPPRLVRTDLPYAALQNIQLLSSKGGSCDVYTAVLDGEPVAVKRVKNGPTGMVERATIDLNAEAALLTELGAKPHRNIIRLIATGTYDGLPFIVLEKLSSTLSDGLPKPSVRFFDALPTEPDEVSWCEWALGASRWPLARSLHVGYQLALALRHLHEREPIPRFRILHRDLKPDNVGFLADSGSLVLFDFGLASRWETSGSDNDETPRQLTGQTGSTRYMSPEVAMSKPYSPKAEVFSFATILWQLCAHERPFRGFKVPDFERRVCEEGYRPKIPKQWPPGLRDLLRDCWRVEPRERPPFSEVASRLGLLLREQMAERGGGSGGRMSTLPVEVTAVQMPTSPTSPREIQIAHE